jgi:hypothetical protein
LKGQGRKGKDQRLEEKGARFKAKDSRRRAPKARRLGSWKAGKIRR